MHSLEMIKYINSPEGQAERKRKEVLKARKAFSVPPVNSKEYYAPQPVAFALLTTGKRD